MSTPKIIRAAQTFLQQTGQGLQRSLKNLVNWLLRNWLRLGQQPSRAGFVLPTTVLLVLVVVLTVGAISYRTYSRSQQVIGERQQRVIYNAATPAIDRAKSKLEYLFEQDTRGGRVPSQSRLMGMLLNDGRDVGGGLRIPQLTPSPYDFPDEEPIAGFNTPAWRYPIDLDNDGVNNGPNDGVVAYSITFIAPDLPDTPNARNPLQDSTPPQLAARANNRAGRLPFALVRNAPLSNASETSGGCSGGTSAQGLPSINGDGWFPDPNNSTKIRKNFQINAFVYPNNGNGTIASLELQQDREAVRGFKWAAWFRNDLEIYPGRDFNWNGAMHTEGSIYLGGDPNRFKGFLISSRDSCFYTRDASEITATNTRPQPNNGIPTFFGQFIAGTVRDDSSGNPDRSELHIFTERGQNPTRRELNPSTDSVRADAGTPTELALEPVVLQTQGISCPRNRYAGGNAMTECPPADGLTDPDGDPRRDNPAWRNGDINDQGRGRMVNIAQPTPFVDDFFRADDRFGPKPRYTDEIRLDATSRRLGTPIVGEPTLTDNQPPAGAPSSSVGLDGYWERRARLEGLRLIVGPRLELGDIAGWGGPDDAFTGSQGFNTEERSSREPLTPWEICQPNFAGRCNEARQRRTLMDSLAAVQATAIYHAGNQNGGADYPVACLASTVHPGTPATLDRGSTFENLVYGSPAGLFNPPAYGGFNYNTGNAIISDFFRGRGTNGWEFAPPPLADITTPNSSLRIAMQNLANYAGDPLGGAPSFEPVVDRSVHPFPGMAMWGDFSMLRRILASATSAAGYNSLSPADKTTLHTAACTVGMLAYNLDYLEKFNPSSTNPVLIRLAADLGALQAGARGSGISALPTSVQRAIRNNNNDLLSRMAPTPVFPATTPPTLRDAETTSQDPETYVQILETWRNDPATPAARQAELEEEIYMANLLIAKVQTNRDRAFGFFEGNGTVLGSLARSPFNPCLDWQADPALSSLIGLCSPRAHYPILYSVFPLKPPTGGLPATATTPQQVYSAVLAHADLSDPAESQSVRDARLTNSSAATYISQTNTNVQYQVAIPELAAILPRRNPQAPTLGTNDAWRLPVIANGTGTTPNSSESEFIKVCATPGCSLPALPYTAARIPGTGSLVRIPFKDSALYNGRELESVRALNIDIDLLRQNSIGDDSWLPKSGIIYAFREDAVSEAQIVRPITNTWNNCRSERRLREVATCQMNTNEGAGVSAYRSTDPPLSELKVTPKPVDYYADPDRRPHGFRLRRGSSLIRTAYSPNSSGNSKGISFISANPAYLQGHFNLHRPIGSNSVARADRLEEFTDRLPDSTAYSFDQFYNRRNRNANFANLSTDQWRPAEILADAVTLLSNYFCDGSIEDTFLRQSSLSAPLVRYGCDAGGNGRTSYFAALQLSSNPSASNNIRWMRANIADAYWQARTGTNGGFVPSTFQGDSPIVVTRDGNPLRQNFDQYDRGYQAISARDVNNALIEADQDIQMNMIMVSGINPSRTGQSYGGLQNFPRFIEDWGQRRLYISGAFLQLEFSTYATAPFDLENYQPTDPAPTTGGTEATQFISYYDPPDRLWGYDVGLQYLPPGPIAERFVSPVPTRSEFYSEPPTTDPYIANLCRQIPGARCPA